MPLGKTVAIVNQKGGVGKTTTCVNLCAGLAEEGKRVLLCDFDPQANSTSGMGVDKSVSLGIYDVLVGNAESRDVLVKTRWGDVLPSNKALAGAGVELLSMEKWQFLLKDALSQVAEEVKRYFPGKVYATVIPRNVRLSEAPSHGKPISAYDPYSRGAEAYATLAEEVAGKRT